MLRYAVGQKDEVEGTGVWSSFKLKRDKDEKEEEEKKEKK